MKHQNGSNQKLQLSISLVVFIAVIVLGFIFQNQLQETVSVSLQYIVWLGDIFIKTIGQRFIWLFILIVALGLSFDFSRLLKTSPKKRIQPADEIVAPESGRIDFWRYRIYRYRKVSDGNNYFLLEFPRLIIETLAFHMRKEPEQIKKGIISGKIDVPDEVRNFVALDDLSIDLDQNPGLVDRIKEYIQQFQGESTTPELVSDFRLEKVAAYLEDLLEDENDD